MVLVSSRLCLSVGPTFERIFTLRKGRRLVVHLCFELTNVQLFYMLKGDMVLKVMEKGEPKDIPIKEGEVCVVTCWSHYLLSC